MKMAISKFRIAIRIFLFLGLLVALSVGYIWVALHWSYSKGERSGYVQKMSLKGWFCKTHEGELTMLPVAGMVPEKFPFTIREPLLADKINAAMGKMVLLTYEQHKGLPTDCFGETEYFITEVKVIE